MMRRCNWGEFLVGEHAEDGRWRIGFAGQARALAL